MRISLSESRSNGFKKWSDAHPVKPDKLNAYDGQVPLSAAPPLHLSTPSPSETPSRSNS